MTELLLSSILHPQYLHNKYKDNLLQVYKEDYENKSNTYGYVISVHNISKILSSNINNNNEIIVESYCNCDVFKPVIGMEVECIISLIHVNGIFMGKHGVKMIVSSSDDYEYSENKFRCDDKDYVVGDSISVTIVDVRYDKFSYSCVGKLILRK
jgi:DNA-directed RNA polymerase subunit E'/Rpb7